MNDVVVRRSFDPATGASVAVVVAETLGLVVDADERPPPLAESVDTDSLDALFASPLSPHPDERLRLTFPYGRWDVTVSGGGEITVRNHPDPAIPGT